MNRTVRNIFIASLISASLVTSAVFVSPASALTTDEIQSQIKELLAKIASLQEQIRGSSSGQASTQSSGAISITAVPRICKILPSGGLALGARGESVTGLQEFLKSEGYLSAQATGYFGPMTRDALRSWQASQNIDQVGVLGPITRARILSRCGQSDLLSVSPSSGSAPLTVTVMSKIGDQGIRPSAYDGQDTLIDFGDGSERQWVECATTGTEQSGQSMGGTCKTPATYAHTYTKDGTYTVSIVKAGGMCMGGCPERIVATAYVTVGNGPVACTKEYMPVCGSKQVVCFTAPCNPVQQTYSNKCMMAADGATFVHEGACRNVDTDPSADPRCKSWNDGCNTCSRSTPGGMAACTLKYCAPESMTKPYCTAYFENNSNRAPSISSFSGPTVLEIGKSGTWTILASDPENEQLTYSITWGDEGLYGYAMAPSYVRDSFVQTTTFTHAYANPGMYTVSIVVRDASGNESKSSATVRIGDGSSTTICTMEYAPVCGRPTGCANTCPPGMYCAAVCRLHEPQTYGNRCQLKAANAQFLHEGACTSSSGNWY